jgi:hypothetical protein
MKLGRKVLLGPDNAAILEQCDRDIKEAEDWAVSGKAGLPTGIGRPIAHTPTNHESAADDQKCKRCGIEKIYETGIEQATSSLRTRKKLP